MLQLNHLGDVCCHHSNRMHYLLSSSVPHMNEQKSASKVCVMLGHDQQVGVLSMFQILLRRVIFIFYFCFWRLLIFIKYSCVNTYFLHNHMSFTIFFFNYEIRVATSIMRRLVVIITVLVRPLWYRITIRCCIVLMIIQSFLGAQSVRRFFSGIACIDRPWD